MPEDFQMELQDLGLLPTEAQVYLALLRSGALGGSAIASVTGFPRSSVYLTLNSLLDKGLVVGGAGHGTRFSAIAPEQALPSLIAREREEVLQREQLAGRLVEQLSLLAAPVETIPEEFIQVIRSPRGVAERVERLEQEAKERIEGFVKGPFFALQDNPAQEKALRRGVVIRSLYERTVLEVAAIKPFLKKWLSDGEEARVYEGELPHKLAIFDRQSVLVHLTMPGDQMRTLFIRHTELANSLGMLFDSLWAGSKPLQPEDAKETVGLPKDLAGKGSGRNGKGQRLSPKPGKVSQTPAKRLRSKS